MTKLTDNICTICNKPILIQIFKNSGVCCERCRKERDHDTEPWRGLTEAPIGGERK